MNIMIFLSLEVYGKGFYGISSDYFAIRCSKFRYFLIYFIFQFDQIDCNYDIQNKVNYFFSSNFIIIIDMFFYLVIKWYQNIKIIS